MTTGTKPKIVVVGAGIAGSLAVSGLAERSDIELICLERAAETGQIDAGTGLNIGPNAIKALAAIMPERARTLIDNSLPWKQWTVELTDGTPLMNLDLGTVADNAGIRIRWAELYALLRRPIARHIRFGTELTSISHGDEGLFVDVQDASGAPGKRICGIDLIIAADGRYSVARQTQWGQEPPNFLGVCLYRLLVPAGIDCPIDDYGQWFNGPNRLLAFRVPGDFVYIAGSFPIPADSPIPETAKLGPALRGLYTPQNGSLTAHTKFLVDAVETYADRIHWARLQDGTVQFAGPPGVLLLGDAAHPMVPTLGQGATQSVEDACVLVDEVRRALDRGEPLDLVPARVEARRRERVEFVVSLSRAATDTMLEGADPVAGTLKKTQPAFLSQLERLYRDVPEPLA
ncbi:MAG: FAD-dependent monooxygenase [Devosia sp.]|uniref:FAD-dependent oxidoreductase n=1 Tax=Devosia sp. TaxID=1871048 RepID=UPI0026129FBC|nr:NAD(P)/FAD-dependent oxidoreductase [Devosia sp.]MDB5531313.1 FAD-dependent monooxygenase [Devosia sp.]